MTCRDCPSTCPMLRKLDRRRRNTVIVQTWLERQDEWGKTLVFACDIQHAEHLKATFSNAGVDTAVHSQSEDRREEVITAFRAAQGNAVLISVGMLLEGVDIRDARTAFLTRPTKSRVLMRQMMGRVLRGPSAGGDAIAHVVDFRDTWSEDYDILAPVDLPGIPVVIAEDDESSTERRLPPVLDELASEPIGEDVLRRIERAYEASFGVPHLGAMSRTELVGFDDLVYMRVPVFEHALERWEELIKYELTSAVSPISSPLLLFEDLPAPRPAASDIKEFVKFCRSHHFAPTLMPLCSQFSVRELAERQVAAGALTEAEKFARLRSESETTLARSAFGSFQAFLRSRTAGNSLAGRSHREPRCSRSSTRDRGWKRAATASSQRQSHFAAARRFDHRSSP